MTAVRLRSCSLFFIRTASGQALQTKDSTTGRLSVPILNGRFKIAVTAVSPYN